MKPVKRSKKTPRRQRGESPVMRKARYKGKDLAKKKEDVDYRLGLLYEDASGAVNNPRKNKLREKAINKLEKRASQYQNKKR